MAAVLISLAFLAGILSKYNRRGAALAFGYGLIILLFKFLFPSPAALHAFGLDYSWWFVACAAGEAALILWAWTCKAPGSPYIAMLSTINMLMHLVVGAEYQFLHSALLYGLYGVIVPTVEVTQIITLFAFTGPVIWAARKLIHHLQKRNPTGWHLTLRHG